MVAMFLKVACRSFLGVVLVTCIHFCQCEHKFVFQCGNDIFPIYVLGQSLFSPYILGLVRITSLTLERVTCNFINGKKKVGKTLNIPPSLSLSLTHWVYMKF